MFIKTTVIFFSDFDWHDLGFLGKILIFLGFLGKINCQDLGKKSKKSKILARNEKKIQDLGKKFKIIQDHPRSWQENQDAKHWVAIVRTKFVKPIQTILTQRLSSFPPRTIFAFWNFLKEE